MPLPDRPVPDDLQWDAPLGDKGTAEPATGEPDEGEHAASLYIPDPQFPGGWYRYWVKRKSPAPGQVRRLGF